MRRLALAGLLAAPAAAAGFQFDVVVDSTMALSAGSFTGATQVVLSSGRRVASLSGVDALGFGFGFNAVVEHLPSGGGFGFEVRAIEEGDVYGTTSFEQFAEFANLSYDGARLSFVGRTLGNDFGVFQYDASLATPESRLAVQGDPIGGDSVNLLTQPGQSRIGLQTNAAGGALFAGSTPPGAAQALFRGAASPATVALSGTATMRDYIDTNPAGDGEAATKKRVLTSGGSSVFLARSGVAPNYGVFELTGGGSIASRFPVGGVGLGSATLHAERLLGATDAAAEGGAAFTLLRARFHVGGAPTSDAAVVLMVGATPVVLDTYIDPGPGLSITLNHGAMTPGGRAAYYLPSLAGSGADARLRYHDAPAASGATLAVGEDLAPGADPLEIKRFGIDPAGGAAPAVNENGWVVFDARVAPQSQSGGDDALVAWNPSFSLLQVVARVGQSLDLNGQTVTVTGLVPLAGGLDADVLKDGLADDDHLAFAISYQTTVEGSFGNAIVITRLEIPEPSSAALVALAGLLSRRPPGRRRRAA